MHSSAAVPDTTGGAADAADAECGYRLYILRCADGSLYTGIALDTDARLREHDGNRAGAKYLRGRGPFEKVFECSVGNRSTAQQLEYRVKRLTRAQKLRLIRGKLSPADLVANQTSGSGSG